MYALTVPNKRPRFQVIAEAGDGEEAQALIQQAYLLFGQYLADFTTAVKYGMNITHVLLRNDELGKISREQITVGNLVTADQTLLTTVVSLDPIYAYFNSGRTPE